MAGAAAAVAAEVEKTLLFRSLYTLVKMREAGREGNRTDKRELLPFI